MFTYIEASLAVRLPLYLTRHNFLQLPPPSSQLMDAETDKQSHKFAVICSR
jgi:hypothetical protein